jgi:hypothetical protein
MDKSEYPAFQKIVNLLRFTKYGVFVGVLLIFLPLTAYRPIWLHRLFGNLFQELSGWHIFFLTVAICGAAWSLVFTQGLIIQGLAIRYRIEDLNEQAREARIRDLIHEQAQQLLTVPLTRGQLGFVALFSASGLWVINRFADDRLLISLTMTVLGVIASVFVAIVPVILVRLAFPGYSPLEFLKPEHRAWFWARVEEIGRLPVVRGFKKLARWCVRMGCRSFMWAARHLHMKYLLRDEYQANHFLAALAAVTLALILIAVGLLFAPGDSAEASPAFYLYVLLMLVIWVFSLLDFHLSRRRVSPLLIVVAAVVVGDCLHGRDHYYDVEKLEAPNRATITAPPKKENLVVVASTGGGISAAGWTTWALKELIAARPDVRHELGLVSAVSGGAVGTAFFVDGLAECAWKTEPGATELDLLDARCLEAIYRRSVAPSLGAVAFGLAYPDFWRIFTMGFLPWSDVDRGTYLEDSWRHLAAADLEDAADGESKLRLTKQTRRRPVTSFSQMVESGEVPAFILSTTAMESGRRVMVTPLAFESPCLYRLAEADAGAFPDGAEGPRHGKQRGCTLPEYLEAPEIDVDLWTAARLSATFPWVSPASRAMLDSGCNRSMHHMVDGGYYDNYGVASALDWLETVLRAEQKQRTLKRLAFVELRASATGRPALDEPRPGSFAALIGPLIGLLEIWEASALERNRIATDRFLSKWSELTESTEADGIEIQRFVFETSDVQGLPLSWSLSREQRRIIETEWARPPIQRRLETLVAFLEGPD